MRVWVVIAAYFEETSVPRVIAGLKRHGYHNVIVVDDGSDDKTTEVSKRAGALVLTHPINRGQGAALQTGIEEALRQGADAVITFDADGQHDPKDIKNLLVPLKNGQADVALGSRFLKNTHNAPLLRQWIWKAGALSFRFFYNMKLTDSHNGLRALSAKAASKIKITQRGMTHASEIVEQIGALGFRYKEIPVTITYTDYSIAHGQGSGNAINIMFRMIMGKLIK